MNLSTNGFTTGRKKIFCYEDNINEYNVQSIVKDALLVHSNNVAEIDKLFALYKGQDSVIENRKRNGTNEDINYKAFVSYYSLIADYAANLFMQNPMVYINVDGYEEVSNGLREYNRINRNNNKFARDKTKAYHASICGVAYGFTEMDEKVVFKESVLSPQSVMVIYGDDTDDESMAKVHITHVPDESLTALAGNTTSEVANLLTKKRFTVYTDDFIYEWVDGDDYVDVKNTMPWGCPIVEYKMNPFYIGSFERVVSLIHLLSVLRSDGVNGVVQSIAGIVFGKNLAIPMDSIDDDEDTLKFKQTQRDKFYEMLKKSRTIFANDSKENPASIKYIATELFNADIDILFQGILNDVITITNTPNSVVNLGGSGNSGAAETASGIKQALVQAQNAEPYWFESTREKSNIDLAIAHYQGKLLDLQQGDFEFALQRSVVSDVTSTSDAFAILVNTGVDLADAAEITNISTDPESFKKRILKQRSDDEDRRIENLERELKISNENKVTETIVATTDSGESSEPS